MQPKRYRALHITPGVVDYTNGDQRETVLIKKPALDKMNRSFLGKPVFNFIHKVIEPEVAFNFTGEESEKHAVGVISDVGYDTESGYYFADMMIWDKGTQDNISKGYGVSNAYIPEAGPGGIYNNVPYDEEVTSGEYHHMAIVEEPRYGDVRIFENSKKSKRMKKYILFGEEQKKDVKKNAADPLDKKEEMKLNSDSIVVFKDGSEVPLSEMVEVYKNSADEKKDEKKKKDEEKPTLNMEDTMEIDGKEVSVQELYDNYCAKKNAEDATDDPLEDVVDPALKKNAADDPKKPNEHFKKLKINASQDAEPTKIKINTQKTRLARGKANYGSPVVQKAEVS